MKIIFIACDSFLALRNVRNAELGTKMSEKGYTVKVFVDPHQIEGSKSASIPDIVIEPLLDFNPVSYTRFWRWVYWMNHSRRSFKDPGTYLSKVEYRLAHRRFLKYGIKLQLSVGWLIGLLGLYRLFRMLALSELRKTTEYQRYLYLMKEENPVLVAGFSPEGYREMTLLQAASDLKIPSIIMIRSRDNLTSKIAFLPKVDEYLVWSVNQKNYFYHLYPDLRSSKTSVTGSPQFSFHLDKSYRLSRSDFFKKVNLDPNRPLVVFCLENPAVVPHQQNMAMALAEDFEATKVNHNAQLLIRNHPRAFGSDYDPLKGKNFNNVEIYPEPTSVPLGKHDSDLVRLILEDESMHLATMAYQDVNVNIMSTTIIDSVIFDKPIINVGFDIPKNTSSNITVKRFFKRTDYKIIEKTGATDKANFLEELIELINHYLENPVEKKKERAELVKQDVGISGPESNRILFDCFVNKIEQAHGLR